MRTENIDVAAVLGDLIQEGRDLLLVGDIARDGHELAALLYTRFLVCCYARIRHGLQGLYPTCA